MNSNKAFSIIRPLAAVIPCALLPISVLGLPELSKIEYVLVPALLGGVVSLIYLKLLVRRTWGTYVAATILTLWISLSLLLLMTLSSTPLSSSDISSFPILAVIGTLTFYRQVLAAIAIFFMTDLILLWLIKKNETFER